MLVAGAALLAVPLLLTLQFAELSNRPAELLDEALKGSLYPANLATLAVANIFGTHASYWGPNGASLPDVAHTDDSFNYLFVGWLPLILLLWLGIAGGGAWQQGRRLIAADPPRRPAADARPLHAAVCAGLRLPSRHRHVSPAGGCELRVLRRPRAAVRAPARRLHPQRLAEAARPRLGARGDRSRRRRRRGDRVLGAFRSRTRRADRGGQGRRHPAAGHRRAAASPGPRLGAPSSQRSSPSSRSPS